ncbi:hypothetical protein THIOM_001054 [Candidatus Thiomargarita nelsonii]|uniref:Uncharacterized protein n=1 Tax=Candidatus Thiomargarita nelsonii TaxID=1003181 RepID=A0A176S5I2_9GAMM|nr:hypothetical protein THIOM_001054 [Candidatus Thiomargarita nelsonii]
MVYPFLYLILVVIDFSVINHSSKFANACNRLPICLRVPIHSPKYLALNKSVPKAKDK